MKRFRMIILLSIIWAASLPINALYATPAVAPPTLVSHNHSYPFITKDSTPTLVFKAASGYYIEILKGIQIIGSGEGHGEHLVPITITTPLSDGLHTLTYRSVNMETDEKSSAASISLIVDSDSFDISDIVPMIPSITTPTLINLLERVQPSQFHNQEVKGELSWFHLVTNSDVDSIITVGVNDDYGYPISNLVESSFNLTIDGHSQSAHFVLVSQIAEGVYQFRLELPSPVYGEINLSVDDVSLATLHNLEPITIVSIPSQTHQVAINGSFTLPSTVIATLSDGSTQEVSVNWGESVVNTTQSGTFQFTGTVANYTPSVELHLVVLESEPEPEPIIASILPQTHHVAVNDSFDLPSTVLATLSDGSTQEVSVSWSTSAVNTTHSGTFEFTGNVVNYPTSVKLYLVVTNTEDYRIVLTWDENPRDLDSHLFGSIPEGDFHLYYSNKVFSISEATYAEMELDVTTGYGPETTTIYIKNNLDSGSYRFGVKKYSGINDLSQSNAIVTLHKGNELLGTFTVPNGNSEEYWSVFQIVGGELLFDQEHHLDQLMPDLDVAFEADINRVIGAIHRLPEHPTDTDIADIVAKLNSIEEDYPSITDIESYIVNYDELTPFLYLITEEN